MLSLAEIAALCGGEVIGDSAKRISGINTIDQATDDEIVFVADKKYEKQVQASAAGAILCRNSEIAGNRNLVVVQNPQLAFTLVAEQFYPSAEKKKSQGDSAIIDASVRLPESYYIGEHVSIGAGVKLGNGIQIEDGCRIESGCDIGEYTIIHQNVVIKRETVIGKDCRIHPGAILGADGFGLVKDQGRWRRIPQVGRLVIGDDVDIGANTTVDRGALGNTVIGSGVKMDNLIQIGHNVKIGANTVIAAHTAIAGSTIIGENCEIGGCVGIMDHSEIGDNIKIGGGSVISGRLLEPGVYSSSIKAEPLAVWQKNAAWLRKLSSLAERIRKLENK